MLYEVITDLVIASMISVFVTSGTVDYCLSMFNQRKLAFIISEKPQEIASRTPRSTVGTVTEIYDYLRLLFARVGRVHCPKCDKEIAAQTVQQMADQVMAWPEGSKLLVLAPIVRGRKGEYRKELKRLLADGFVRVRVDGTLYDLAEEIELDKNKKHTIEVVVDRLILKEGLESRLAEALESALKLAEGLVRVEIVDGESRLFV